MCEFILNGRTTIEKMAFFVFQMEIKIGPENFLFIKCIFANIGIVKLFVKTPLNQIKLFGAKTAVFFLYFLHNAELSCGCSCRHTSCQLELILLYSEGSLACNAKQTHSVLGFFSNCESMLLSQHILISNTCNGKPRRTVFDFLKRHFGHWSCNKWFIELSVQTIPGRLRVFGRVPL